eukprot:GILJ01008743.1.p1 GENE.GILJ01008743.1~~GILJ01008743.1.p1  ORF type:complete len:271 (+),score=39.14 GILJ01008743.1:48-860(+)
MHVVPVPVLSDNYAYIVYTDSSKDALLIDPAVPEDVLAVVSQHGLDPKMILTTHKHLDHSGGNTALKQQFPHLEVVGSEEDAIAAVTRQVHGGESFEACGVRIQVISTPCHTRGHVLYVLHDTSSPEDPAVVFTGDTVFIGGCGRFFEGSAAEMYSNFMEKFRSLARNTLVYCGHEYTLNNLLFAVTVDSDNEALRDKLAWAERQRTSNEPTVPSTVAEEMSYNPFMRVHERALQQATGKHDPIEVLAELRKMKDNWGVGSRSNLSSKRL